MTGPTSGTDARAHSLINNTMLLAEATRIFALPAVLTTSNPTLRVAAAR